MPKKSIEKSLAKKIINNRQQKIRPKAFSILFLVGRSFLTIYFALSGTVYGNGIRFASQYIGMQIRSNITVLRVAKFSMQAYFINISEANL